MLEGPTQEFLTECLIRVRNNWQSLLARHPRLTLGELRNLIDDAVNVQQEGRRNSLIGAADPHPEILHLRDEHLLCRWHAGEQQSLPLKAVGRDPPRAATAPYSPSSNVWACSRGVGANFP